MRGHALISNEAVQHFQSFLNSAEPTPYPGKQSLNQFVHKSLSPEQIENMGKEVTREEIKEAFRSIQPNKAPGPDGYDGYFFQKTWHILGEDLTTTIKYFFETRRLLREVNATAITLIPKVANPSSITDYRPISCCTTIYKCISKVIASRLKTVFPTIIDRAQSAFIKDR